MKKISKVNLFLELAQPDKTGNSRKVLVSEFAVKQSKDLMQEFLDFQKTLGAVMANIEALVLVAIGTILKNSIRKYLK